MQKKAARIELINRETGIPIEECDVYTRSDLVACEDGTILSEKISEIDDRISSIENPYTKPCIITRDYNKHVIMDGGDYTITFDIYKGSLPVTDIILCNGASEKRLSDENIATINNTGSLVVDCDITPIDPGDYVINIYVVDDETSTAQTEKISFNYPSYCFLLDKEIEEITEDIVKNNDKIIIDCDLPYTFKINECNNKRIVFATPSELSYIKDLNGFDVTSCYHHNTCLIPCDDGTDRTYHIYYSEVLNLYNFEFKFII